MEHTLGTTRRRFLTFSGATALGAGAFAGEATAASPRLQGGIKGADGKPARIDTVGVASVEEGVTYVRTNNGGRFRFEPPAPRELFVGYYQTTPDSNRLPSPVKDGSPDIYVAANRVPVTNSPVNLGTVRLPPAFLLNVRVVDENDTPVPNARGRVAHLRDGVSWGSGTHLTNADGLFQYEDADSPGTELAGDVLIEIQPPENDTQFAQTTYERQVSLTEPLLETFTLESS